MSLPGPPQLQSSSPHMEPSLKRTRALFGGKYIIDTLEAKLVWEKVYYPTLFFPHSALSEEYYESQTPADEKAKSQVYDIVVGDRRAKGAMTKYSGDGPLSGLLTITFGALDAWFEEDEEVFVHPKDPYKRVDVLQSSRHVRVELNGVEIANTTKPRLLFETSLPMRTYIPKTDCRMDLLQPSDLTTQCPYKGVANYYHVAIPGAEVAKDVVWWYRVPLPECEAIKGFVAFYDEKLDVFVDGVRQTGRL